MLQYIRSDQFGQYGESQKLYDIIQEFITKLQKENEDLHHDNERLAKSIVQYESIISSHDTEINKQDKVKSKFGDEMARWDAGALSLAKKEKKAAAIEKELDQKMTDLVEYTKWINDECQLLRDRVRKSEKVINDLRSSGEASVESLMETLYVLKIKQEELESRAQ
mmetsp:Transcript_32253/g.49368  ORF Transcript_32253/g.49368 Transcript_32253/m.49368 type:complete len:166 (+) Transcript_32253:229-726(+)|eukprot:CAMPEP_0170499202 /NCGR_PEP_ID=MMETSP0208-20121228/30496_1 /TAXON_ID=197538 /ORGANISM="Strombidium inclinatum, Strain S3" /LENGTH=165 /DNA_ID=CAMNT_0010776663 /DNA_START=147 /DNA_END=644 /DNA_ORIENTATION=-